MVEEYLRDGECYRCGAITNVRCDSCSRYVCPDHRVIYNDFNAYSGERTYCFDCAKKKGKTTDSRCFIATAAFGTPFAEEINVLRQFRDEFLLPNFLGRAFVSFYYAVSPPVARLISSSNRARAAVRTLLRPVISLVRRRMRKNS